MDIQFAILGLLSWQPLTGYDLKKIIADSELFYWSGSNNQIYHSLVALHRRGWVSLEIQNQESLPARKIYAITAAGRAQLRGWLLADPELPEYHNPFLIRLAWADMLHGDELDALLARYAEELDLQLRMRQARAERPAAAPERTPRERLLWERIQTHLIDLHRRELDWARQLRQHLQEEKIQGDNP